MAELLDQVLSIINKKDHIEDIIQNKLKLNLSESTLKLILDVLNRMSPNLNGDTISPIQKILDGFKEVLRDGKIDAYDIPVLVKIFTDISNINYKAIKISVNEIGILIKVVVNILINLKVIPVENDENKIYSLIDSSILLLSTTVKLPEIKMSKCLPCL